jgi:hypothetical protein
MEKKKIFISYRQSDTQSEASRLKENLEDVFGRENVFFDIETLEPGLNFAEAIEKTIRQSAVVLVLIGPTWAEIKDDQGNPRLFKEDDWIRKEVAMALALHGSGTTVIPVLIKGAKSLTKSQLPENIQSLADFQRGEITIKRWRYDVEDLIKTLEKSVPRLKAATPNPALDRITPTPKQKNWFARNYGWIIGFILLFWLIGWLSDESSVIDDEQNTVVVVPDNAEANPTMPQEQQQAREANPIGNEIFESLQLKEPEQPADFDYSGKWWLFEDNVRKGYFMISQTGNYFDFEFYYFDQRIGHGKGEYDGVYLFSTTFIIDNDPNNYAFSFGSNDRGKNWVAQTFNNNTSANAELRRP